MADRGERGAQRMTSRRRRTVRGTAAAAVAVLLASVAHTLSGGEAPPLWLGATVMILAAPLCVTLVGRRRSLSGLAAAVAAAQLVLHAAFAAVGTATPLSGIRGHHHATSALAAVDPGVTVMTLGHAVAAGVTFLALAWGERLLAAIALGIRRLLRVLPLFGCVTPFAPPAIARHAVNVIAASFLDCVTRRGPPAPRAPALTR